MEHCIDILHKGQKQLQIDEADIQQPLLKERKQGHRCFDRFHAPHSPVEVACAHGLPIGSTINNMVRSVLVFAEIEEMLDAFCRLRDHPDFVVWDPSASFHPYQQHSCDTEQNGNSNSNST